MKVQDDIKRRILLKEQAIKLLQEEISELREKLSALDGRNSLTILEYHIEDAEKESSRPD